MLSDPAASKPTLILVAGPPRSGTTLLNGMLAGGAAYPMISECSLITSILQNRQRFSVVADPARLRPYVRDDALLDFLHSNFIEQIMASLLSGFPEPRRFIVLKDPHLTHIVDGLHRFFQQKMRTVCTVRDPRDVVASLREVTRRQGEIIDVSTAIHAIKPFYDSLARALAAPHSRNPVMLVKYETLVQRDPLLLDELEAFVGYPIERGGYREVSEWAIEPAGPWHVPTYGSPTTNSRVGAFLQTLSEAEVVLVETLFSAEMERYGYAPLASAAIEAFEATTKKDQSAGVPPTEQLVDAGEPSEDERP